MIYLNFYQINNGCIESMSSFEQINMIMLLLACRKKNGFLSFCVCRSEFCGETTCLYASCAFPRTYLFCTL